LENVYKIEFIWYFPVLIVRPKFFNFTNSVTAVHWQLTCIDTDKNSVHNSGIIDIADPLPEVDNFIPYKQITKDHVIGWVSQVLDVPAIQRNLITKLNNINSPIRTVLSPPFVS
jgi:hypothetical protein